jgi:hypothetical protein
MPDDDFGVSANEDQVTAVVSPRARGEPRLESTAPITADTVDRYLSDSNDVRAAEHELRKLGFTIAVAGPISISISGPRRLFEEVFGVRLQRRRTKVLKRFASSGDVIGVVLAGWRHETNRLPPQRPGPA